VRRVEAVVGQSALDYVLSLETTLGAVAAQVKGTRENVQDKVEQLAQRSRQMEKDIEQLKAKLASGAGTDLAAGAKDINGVKVLAAELDVADPKAMKSAVDQLKDKLGSAVICVASSEGDKVTLVAGVTKDLIGKIKAGDIVKEIAPYVDGRGGGKPEMAQAGGQKPAGIKEALAAFEKFAEANL